MRKGTLFSLLLLAGVLLAQGQSSVMQGLTDMCSTSKSMLSLSGIFCCIGGLIPFLIGGALYYYKKDNKNKRLAGIVLLVLGGIALVIAAFSFAIYFLTPYIVQSIMGSDVTVVC